MLRLSRIGTSRSPGFEYSSCYPENTISIEAEMAERFFLKKDVPNLYLGEGHEFRGEGILAGTNVLLAEMSPATEGKP